MAFTAGTARRVINCEVGDDLCGQLHRRICEGIRDDLEANFLYLADEAAQLLLINLDLAGLFELTLTREMTAEIGAAAGVPARNVIITSTHTHDGPDTLGLLHDAPRNDAYIARLRGWLIDGAKEAASNAAPARVGWGAGHAHIGFNRRLCWQDGTHSMYGDSKRPDFSGIEGPDDAAHPGLFVSDAEGRCLAVVHNSSCHATCIGSATFASADFPGEARRLLREALGKDLVVLYLQGASGDTSPWNMLRPKPHYSGEQRLREIGQLLAADALEGVHEMSWTDAPKLGHAFEDISIPVRLPNEAQLREAEAVEAMGEEKAGRGRYVLQVPGALKLYRLFKDNPVDTLAIHAIRIGDVAIVTNPCELYCQFGLDIKRRSPAPITLVSQLTDGFSGYCPTIYSVMGGGYSSDSTYWTRLEPYAGYRIVEASARLVHTLWPR